MRFQVLALAALLAARNAQCFSILGYYTGDSDSFDSLKASGVDAVAFDAWDVQMDGSVVGPGVPVDKGMAYAKANGLTVFATVSNYGANNFVPALADSVLNDATARANAKAAFVQLPQTLGIAGLNIDFESIPKGDRAVYTSFVQEVAAALQSKGLKLMVSVPATTQDLPNDNWFGAYDYAALGQAVDILQVMTYDQHGPWSRPGPVAALPWVQACIAYSLTIAPASKISQGLNAYAYNWGFPRKPHSRTVSIGDIAALVERTHSTIRIAQPSDSATFTYRQGGYRHVVWTDTNVTTADKARFAKSNGLQGVSVWSLGQEDDLFYDAIRNA